MAKARMLHKKISISMQVSELSLQAKLLFTWLIPHTDDEGKIRGESKYIKGTVVPFMKWSEQKIEKYLAEAKKAGLIYRWEENNEIIIELVKFSEHQALRKDRINKSYLPSFKGENGNHVSTTRQPAVTTSYTNNNEIESNEIKIEDKSGIEKVRNMLKTKGLFNK